MGKTTEPLRLPGIFLGAWADLLTLRPAFALAAVWLTTAGHTASFREMDAARGWMTAEGYSLHSIYLLAITLTLLAAPRLARWSGSYALVVAGLTMLAFGSMVNGVLLHAPLGVLELGRVLAGVGAGLVIRSAPRILPAGQEGRVAWAGIVLPAAGPVVVALSVEWSPWWSWQGGFLFEVVLALLSLALVLSIADPPDLDLDSPSGAAEPLGYLPRPSSAALAVWYVMHWGQLHGWLEGPDITAAVVVASVAILPGSLDGLAALESGTLREGLPRLGLITYGGFVQYFNSSDMGVYGGLLVNFSPWMRSWLIWSLSLGSAAALASAGSSGADGRPATRRSARIACPGRRNEPLAPQHDELALLERAQQRRVQLVRRPPALAARPGAALDGLRQRDGAARDDHPRQPRSAPRGTAPAVPPGRPVHGRGSERGSPRDGAARRAPGPVFLRFRPGLHPAGRARRPAVAARRAPGDSWYGGNGAPGRNIAFPQHQL